MLSTKPPYEDFLKLKLAILEKIRDNTAAQSGALEREDYIGLGQLLKDRQNCIERLGLLMESSAEYGTALKTGEAKSLENDISAVVQAVLGMDNANRKKAEKQKGEMADRLRSLKLGRSAISSGYFKRMPQRYGYFIDKKVGR